MRDFRVGDEVVLVFDTYALYKVIEILDDGKILIEPSLDRDLYGILTVAPKQIIFSKSQLRQDRLNELGL